MLKILLIFFFFLVFNIIHKKKDFFYSKINLFNIDLHISVIEDFKNIINKISHIKVNDYSISGHHAIMNKILSQNYHIKKNNWKQILNNDKELDLFYIKHKEELKKYQGFVVTHTPSFILLYEKFKKPIILINSCRYEIPFQNNIKKWNKLSQKLKKLNKNKLLYIVSNNKADMDYLYLGTGIKSVHIPSLCLYIDKNYKGNKNKLLIIDRFNIIKENDLMIKKKNALKKGYKNEDLLEFKGIVHIPYEISTMSIFEQYSCNIPLFFPSKNFLYQLIKENKIKLQSKYSKIYPITFKNPLQNNKDFSFWVERADFYDIENMKYITYFDSIEHLNYLLKNSNYTQISKNMENHNKLRKKQCLKKWKQLIKKVFPESIK